PTRAHLDEFLAEQEAQSGGELDVDVHDNLAEDNESTDPDTPSTNGAAGGNGHPSSKLHIVELNEVRSINSRLKELEELGFSVDALTPKVRAGRQDSPFYLVRGENRSPLDDLRGLPAAIRSAGERGLTITRFKGLGEMNPEELRETTLDPEFRTLVQVTMSDAGDADIMFRTLMGDKVEPRREFIEKHALEVKNLDV
ncbi:MAG: DNA gyrase subunit B, partial [Pirellulales bacterium]|nr:DNA gyrase subunit B [Pirellulales bacterium]